MKELSKEKILKHLAHMFKCYEYNFINVEFKPPEEGVQAHQQIVQIIKLHFSEDWQQVKKDLGEFMQGKKVTEEFVEKWIKKLTETYPASNTDTFYYRKQLAKMLKEVGIEVVKKGEK